ncbi:MAG: sodium-dependent bicarbonate transport family permease [Schlesneria sp.]|nr:sodium-dependent bicarbonate transport family permease [Schlesneria sp.]
MLHEFLDNFLHNLFKPLLLFFYAGFLIPLFKVKLEFPKAVYQGMTIYLLLAIGWHGGEELAGLEPAMLKQALGFMLIGCVTNTVIGFMAYGILRGVTKIRQVDAATVAGYYGSDSAGTFVTAMGVLTAAQIAYAPYMPVMLAVMEIPGCLVALYIVSQLRRKGMDGAGNMPLEPDYDPSVQRVLHAEEHGEHGHGETQVKVRREQLVGVGTTASGTSNGNHNSGDSKEAYMALEEEANIPPEEVAAAQSGSWLNRETLHEVFMNPGIFLLFAGIAIGFIGRVQGSKVTASDDPLFINLFHGILCIFLLEMGITACSKLRDLGAAGWQFVAFAIIAPNIFATTGILVAHGYSMFLGQPFEIGTYLLFAVLCGASSYIAVPAVQRLAIPEASPTLPLAASLGCTFSYNVTIGIPVYILIATAITRAMPVG